MKVELLAPAGDQESLIAAIENGADAIYLGGTLFNARAFAKNFNHEQLLWAVQYAHLRNVRIFVTVNTLYKDDEFEDLLAYIHYLYDIQVDALIVQDIGLFDLVRLRYPDFEIHMSTQASLMNHFGVKYFEDKGASRIVLARENTIEEIRYICQNTSLDVEVFVHGALCVCYSGQCLMSSFIGKRSGNRGACAQPCRLNYQLLANNQPLENSLPFLLSPKDLMTIDHIGELIDAGVYSFKIEGRMKRPEYVASVVKAYRQAIDAHLHKEKRTFEDEINDMKAMFNRDYTSGYLFHDSYLLTGDYSGNKGILVGTVKHYDKKKKRVLCHLNQSLKQGDSIVFETIDKGRPINKMYKNNQLIALAQANEEIEIEFDFPVYQGNIRRIINKDVIKKLQTTYEKETRKQPLSMTFVGKCHQPASLTITYQDYTITHKSQECFEKANQTPLSKERIHQQMAKLGQSVFTLKDIEIDLDEGITIPIKCLNELRRQAVDDLTHILMNKKVHHCYCNEMIPLQTIPARQHHFEVMVSSLEQLKSAILFPIHRLYYPYQKDSLKAYEICKKQQIPFVLVMPRICKDTDIKEILQSSIYQSVDHVMVHEQGSYDAFQNKNVIIGTGFNLYNSYSCHHYKEEKILSLEMSNRQIKQLQTDFRKCSVQVYGKVENMVSDYCPISQYHFHKQVKNCQLCQKNHYALLDRKKARFDLMMDEKCRMHLLNSQTLYIDALSQISTQGLFLHFTNEKPNLVQTVLEDFIRCEKLSEKSQLKHQLDTTQGYFKE